MRLAAHVAVIGAGYAGLSAAWRLQGAGKEVVVLEARDRIGGRSWTEYLPDGTHIDRGCGWVGAGHDRMYGLAQEMGIATYPTWFEGDHLAVNDGKPARYGGTIPKGMGFLQLASLALAVARLERMAGQVPRDEPWAARKAERWDALTLDRWLGRATMRGGAQTMLGTTLADIFCTDLSDVSLLGGLHLLSSNHGFGRLVNIEGGHQESRVVGGTQAVLDRVHERLGEAVRLNSAVEQVRARPDGVELVAGEVTVEAEHAIVAVPLWLSDRIRWDPTLPAERAQLIAGAPIGAAMKFHFIYDTAWWRDDGLSGQSLDASSHVPVTLDACGPEPAPGVLFAIAAGREARELAKLPADERRETLVSELTTRFGPKARQIEGFVEQDWTAEPWVEGGMTVHFQPGALTSVGAALREPFGRVHWAGTESAREFMGTMEGAIESGYRAADEVISAG